MPEVQDWVASSGFSLEELGSIQPGYESAISFYRPWDLVAEAPADGPYVSETNGMRGLIRHARMEGP